MLTDTESTALGKALSEMIEERGLGALSKKDYELLIFHHLSNSKSLNLDWNYVLANKLKITETKVKALRLESSIRHKQANHKAVLGDIVGKIIAEINKPEFTDGNVSMTLENPVERREFEYAVKLAKHSIEYGINREILLIKPLALFEIIVSNVDNPEKIFKGIVQAHIAEKEKQQAILDKTLTFRQKINKLGEEISNKSGLVSMLTSAAGSLLTAIP